MEQLTRNKDHNDAGAGILILAATTGRVLLLLRSNIVDESNTWGIAGGKIDAQDASPKSAALREMEEETKYNGSILVYPAHIFTKGSFVYYNFVGIIPDEFEPILDQENNEAKWFDLESLPENLHSGVRILFDKSKKLINCLREP